MGGRRRLSPYFISFLSHLHLFQISSWLSIGLDHAWLGLESGRRGHPCAATEILTPQEFKTWTFPFHDIQLGAIGSRCL